MKHTKVSWSIFIAKERELSRNKTPQAISGNHDPVVWFVGKAAFFCCSLVFPQILLNEKQLIDISYIKQLSA